MSALWHCTKCHHEWPGDHTTCEWCGAEGRLLAEDEYEAGRQAAMKLRNGSRVVFLRGNYADHITLDELASITEESFQRLDVTGNHSRVPHTKEVEVESVQATKRRNRNRYNRHNQAPKGPRRGQ